MTTANRHPTTGRFTPGPPDLTAGPAEPAPTGNPPGSAVPGATPPPPNPGSTRGADQNRPLRPMAKSGKPR